MYVCMYIYIYIYIYIHTHIHTYTHVHARPEARRAAEEEAKRADRLAAEAQHFEFNNREEGFRIEGLGFRLNYIIIISLTAGSTKP